MVPQCKLPFGKVYGTKTVGELDAEGVKLGRLEDDGALVGTSLCRDVGKVVGSEDGR